MLQILIFLMLFLIVGLIINMTNYKKRVNKEIEDLKTNIKNIGLNNCENIELGGDYKILNDLNKTIKDVVDNIQCMLKKSEESRKLYMDSNNKLKELDETKNTFLSTVSHEFRVPLTSIMGFAKIMRKKFNKTIMPEIEKAKTKNLDSNFNKLESELLKSIENIDIIVSESERLTDMINNILDIAKIESGEVHWYMEKVNILEVINKAILTTYSILEDKDIELVDIISEDLPMVYCDKDKILQVLINLLSNAVKFTNEGKIICSAKVVKNNICISVEDTGIGIKDEYLKDIFGRFKQVGDTLKDKPKGSGLGLTISKAIVEQHGGEIWVESKIGVGSKFIFTLPLN